MLMCLDGSLWQAAEAENNKINLIQSKTNKRFRGWDSSGWEDRKVSNQDNRRGSHRGRLKRRKKKKMLSFLIHVVKAGILFWNCLPNQASLDHRDETWEEEDLRVGQQTAWHINHPSPAGHGQCSRTQVAQRHGLPGSVHMERSPRKVTAL